MTKAAETLRKSRNTQYSQSCPASSLSWLVETVTEIVQRTEKTLNPTTFVFRNLTKAAEANARILSDSEFDLDDAIKSQPGSIVYPGSNFHPIPHIEPLFCDHEF